MFDDDDWFNNRDKKKDKKNSFLRMDLNDISKRKKRCFSLPPSDPKPRLPESIPGPKIVGTCQPFTYSECGNYVQIELLDKKGNPVPNEPFILKYPDGKKDEYKLDGKYGFAGKPIGSKYTACWVTFPNIAPSYWKPKSGEEASSEMESVEGSKEYIVEQGDTISSIASKLTMSSEYIWDHPKNNDLRKSRQSPNSLVNGDHVYIPEKLIRWEKCSINNLNSFEVCKPDVPLPDFVFDFHIDAEAPEHQDDLFVLTTVDGSWKHEIKVSDLKEYAPDMAEMIFPSPPESQTFHLFHDTKDGAPPFYFFKNVSYDDLLNARDEQEQAEANDDARFAEHENEIQETDSD